jgi:hypothetical protein
VVKKLTALDHAKEAAQHHTTLCQFDAVARLALGSDIHHSAQKTGERIAALCRAEQQRQLKRYDAALALVTSGVQACSECHGTREVLGHADDCDNDLCALNGDMHSCAGKMGPCPTCGVSPSSPPGCAEPNHKEQK